MPLLFSVNNLISALEHHSRLSELPNHYILLWRLRYDPSQVAFLSEWPYICPDYTTCTTHLLNWMSNLYSHLMNVVVPNPYKFSYSDSVTASQPLLQQELDGSHGNIFNASFLQAIRGTQLDRLTRIKQVCRLVPYSRLTVEKMMFMDHTRRILYCIPPKCGTTIWKRVLGKIYRN